MKLHTDVICCFLLPSSHATKVWEIKCTMRIKGNGSRICQIDISCQNGMAFCVPKIYCGKSSLCNKIIDDWGDGGTGQQWGVRNSNQDFPVERSKVCKTSSSVGRARLCPPLYYNKVSAVPLLFSQDSLQRGQAFFYCKSGFLHCLL